MECEKCDRNPFCDYRIDATTVMEQAKGEYHFVPGRDCPKDWQDKKVEDMTEEQSREAVKALRKIVVERITEPVKDIEKNIKDNMVISGLWTAEEADMASKEYKEKMKELTSYESEDWKPVFDKPPLGCKPAQLVCTDRIKVVADAISRCAESPKFNSQLVRRWATEIELQCDIFERC